MTENNNNQDNSKIYEMMQKENRWNRITGSIQTIVALIPTLILLWKSLKPKKPTPKQRLMQIEAAMARLQLEREYVRREATHEAEVKKMETGLDMAENKLDLFSGLKKQGESLLKDKISSAKEKVGNQIVDKIFEKEKE